MAWLDPRTRKEEIMTAFCAGSRWEIEARLKLEGRSIEIAILQFTSRADIDGTPGWCPAPDADVFPIAPQVGDTLLLKSYYSAGSDSDPTEDEERVEQKWWRVVERSIMQSGPAAGEMIGIIHLLVECVDGPWGNGDGLST